MNPELKANIISPISRREINGYANIDMADQNFIELLGDGQCLEIIAEDIVNFVSLDKVPALINAICAKVAIGGSVMISTTELFEISRDICNRDITIGGQNFLESVNSLLYNGRQNVLSGETIIGAVEENGFKIIKNRTNSYKTYITAERTK